MDVMVCVCLTLFCMHNDNVICIIHVCVYVCKSKI